MEGERRKFDLFVHGNILSRGYLSIDPTNADMIAQFPYENVDLNHGIIVEGNMEVDNIYAIGKTIGASGYISGKELGYNIHKNGSNSNKA